MFHTSDKLEKHSETNQSQSSEKMSKVKKKSILVTPEYKRGSSKATIQWEEGVKGRGLEVRIRLDKKNRLHIPNLFMAHGSKRSYIQEVIMKLRAEEAKMFGKTSEEDSQEKVSQKRMDGVLWDLLHDKLHKTMVKGVDLTEAQQVNLELLKQKVKQENDEYLKKHPELDILLSLVYRKLLKAKPKDPKRFVAYWIHYYNKNREELVLDDINVPFDQPPIEEEEPNVEITSEKLEIEDFARGIVEKCAVIASRGSALANATGIIESILQSVDKSEDNGSISSLRSAEEAVKGVLMSMLTSVVQVRTRSADIIVEEVMDSVFENVCPSLRSESEDFLEIRDSVETFVRSMLTSVANKATKLVMLRERLNRFEKNMSEENDSKSRELDTLSTTSKSILKKVHSDRTVNKQKLSVKPELKSKVKFQSIALAESTSQELVSEQ